MTGAARLLNVTQPAISALIKNFEKDCGIRLFLRQGGVWSQPLKLSRSMPIWMICLQI